jgi:hypothetical protein
MVIIIISPYQEEIYVINLDNVLKEHLISGKGFANLILSHSGDRAAQRIFQPTWAD